MKTRTLNFKAVQYMEIHYTNQLGIVTNHKPRIPTVNGCPELKTELAMWHYDYPDETEYERAVRLDILDKWITVATLVLTANKSLEYKGKAAKKIIRAYNAYIYGKRYGK